MKTKGDLRKRWYRARGHAGSRERLEGFGQLATIYTRTKCQMLGRGVECHGAARWWTRPRQNQPSAVPGSLAKLEKGMVSNKAYLIFVTGTTGRTRGEKSVMWRNFKFLYLADVEITEISPHVESFESSPHDICGAI